LLERIRLSLDPLDNGVAPRWSDVFDMVVREDILVSFAGGHVTKNDASDVAEFFGVEVLAPALRMASNGLFSVNLLVQFTVTPYFVFGTCGLYKLSQSRQSVVMKQRGVDWIMLAPLIGELDREVIMRWLEQQRLESAAMHASRSHSDGDELTKSAYKNVDALVRYGRLRTAASCLKNNVASADLAVIEKYSEKFPQTTEEDLAQFPWPMMDIDARLLAEAQEVVVTSDQVRSMLKGIRKPDGIGPDGLPPIVVSLAAKKVKEVADALSFCQCGRNCSDSSFVAQNPLVSESCGSLETKRGGQTHWSPVNVDSYQWRCFDSCSPEGHCNSTTQVWLVRCRLQKWS
jgi:hypothetical protein